MLCVIKPDSGCFHDKMWGIFLGYVNLGDFFSFRFSVGADVDFLLYYYLILYVICLFEIDC